MDCTTVVEKIRQLQPEADLATIARLCLLLQHDLDTNSTAQDSDRLDKLLHDAHLKMKATDDQRAAVVDELKELASSDPKSFQQEQIWVLVRAIKVLSHTAHLYAGDPELDI